MLDLKCVLGLIFSDIACFNMLNTRTNIAYTYTLEPTYYDDNEELYVNYRHI